jgi:hypothetical protein
MAAVMPKNKRPGSTSNAILSPQTPGLAYIRILTLCSLASAAVVSPLPPAAVAAAVDTLPN